MIKCQIEVFSHFFKVSRLHPGMYVAMRKAFDELTKIQWQKVNGRYVKKATDIYAARGCDGSYRFHINYLSRFKEILRANWIDYENENEVTWINHPVYEGAEVNLKVRSWVSLYDYQQDCLNYALDTGYSKLITLQTGKGKGITSMAIGQALKTRTLVLVLAKYAVKWKQELEQVYEKGTNIYLIDGTSKMNKFLQLLEVAKRGDPLPDVIILTTSILSNYIREWEAHGGAQLDGMVPPEEIYETLGIGYRIIDEAHQHYHAVFKSDLYTHCPKSLYLTATLDTNDKFMGFIYQLMWPLSMRTKSLEYDKYDEVYALLYTHQNPDKIRWKSKQGYNHIMYEQSIWKHVPSRCQYLDMIGDQVENWFVPIYQPGRKMLIFCAMVETCVAVVDYLNYRFKDKGWKIGKYTSGDSKDVIDTSDITVSTLGKSGTGLDISGLLVVLMTNALSEPKANKQAKGRNRDLSKKPGFEGIVPKFLYFVAEDLKKPLQYHKEKKLLFGPLTLKQVEQRIGSQIGKPMHEYLQFGKQAYWEGWKAKEGQTQSPVQKYPNQKWFKHKR